MGRCNSKSAADSPFVPQERGLAVAPPRRAPSQSVKTALNSEDITMEIVSYVPTGALLPVFLSCRRFRDGVRRLFGGVSQLNNDPREFCTSAQLLQFALSLGMPKKVILLCTYAAECGSLEALAYVVEGEQNKLKFPNSMLASAALGGNIEVLEYALNRSEGVVNQSEVCASAALGGHLHVLKWLHQKGYSFCEQACICAAQGGHLHILEWLRLEIIPPCPWNIMLLVLGA